MGYAVRGDEVFDKGDLRRPLETASSHVDATGVATSRAASSQGTSVTPAATAYTEVALSFDDAREFFRVVDLDKARAVDLRQAVADEATVKEIATLTARTDQEVSDAHAVIVKAQPASRAGRHGGIPYAEGDFIVNDPVQGITVVSAKNFGKLYKSKPKAPKPLQAES